MIARGRGRGVLKDSAPPPRVGDAFSQMSEEPLLMDIRITEIIDVCTFWAQIGTGRFILLPRALCLYVFAYPKEGNRSGYCLAY